MKKIPLSKQLVFEKSVAGSSPYAKNPSPLKSSALSQRVPESYLRKGSLGLPELSERDTVFHYTHLAKRTYSVDTHFYPLGSCTMKYNPKVNETLASLEKFLNAHPLQDSDDVQGCLEILYDFERKLRTICGMDAFSLQPAAGAHGELTGILIAKKYFENKKEKRTKVVVPDSSHGTNPASAALCGFHVVTIPSKNGEVDLEALARECTADLAVFMLTNPNTLGLFETKIKDICAMVHQAGGLTYYDGANLNALLGIARPGEMGFDMMHVNLHKTFSTPHGGGGPGSGPVGVRSHLEDFLPVPYVRKNKNKFEWADYRKHSIGSMKSFLGNFGVILRAAIYVDSLGMQGLKEVSEMAILNANYLRKRLEDKFHIPYNRSCMHEFVMAPHPEKSPARAMDMAKRLLDFGIHAPTVYFPLIVKEAMMIEPTETESKAMLDEFVEIFFQIAEEARWNPEWLTEAPTLTFRSRLDEVSAARNLILKA